MSGVIPNYSGTLKDSSSLSGVYRARVENNMDPLKIGRVKVRVPIVHGVPGKGITEDGLPWAYPCFMSAGYGYGSYVVPEVGEYVFIMFEDDDSSKPVYLGSSYGSGGSAKTYGSSDGQGTWRSAAGENEVPIDAQRDEPTRKIVYKSPKGAAIEIDDKNGSESIAMIDALGQMIKMESHLTSGAEHHRPEGDMDTLSKAGPDDTTGSRVVIMDSSKQKFEMTSSVGSSNTNITCPGFSIDISSSGGSSTATFRNKNGAKIVIGSDGKIEITGSNNVSITGPNNVDVVASLIRLIGNVTIIGS